MNTIMQIRQRIAEIDKMFEEATGWGSWMSEASAERRGLVRDAKRLGYTIPDKWVLTCSDGTISD